VWPRIRNKPYHCRYEWIHSTNGPNQEAVKKTEVGISCRDSEGRERIERRTNSSSDCLESAQVYDPVKELEFILLGDSQVIQFSPDPSAFSAHTFELDDGSAIALPDARQPHIGDYVGEEEIGGMVCKRYSVIREGKYTLEYWFSTELEEIVRIKISTKSRKSEYRLFDIRRVNPDMSVFAMPQEAKRHLV